MLICCEAEGDIACKLVYELLDRLVHIFAAGKAVEAVLAKLCKAVVDVLFIILTAHKEHADGILRRFLGFKYVLDVIAVGSAHKLTYCVDSLVKSILVNTVRLCVIGNILNKKVHDLNGKLVDLIEHTLAEVMIDKLCYGEIIEIVVKLVDLFKIERVNVIAAYDLVAEEHIEEAGKNLISIDLVSIHKELENGDDLLFENCEQFFGISIGETTEHIVNNCFCGSTNAAVSIIKLGIHIYISITVLDDHSYVYKVNRFIQVGHKVNGKARRTGDVAILSEVEHKLIYVNGGHIAVYYPLGTLKSFVAVAEVGNGDREAVGSEDALYKVEIEAAVGSAAVRAYAVYVGMICSLSALNDMLLLTVAALVYCVSGSDTGSLDLSYEGVAMLGSFKLFALYEQTALGTDVDLVSVLTAGSLLIVRVLESLVLTAVATVSALAVLVEGVALSKTAVLSGGIEGVTVNTVFVVLTVGSLYVPMVRALILVVILIEHLLATVTVMLGVASLKTGSRIYGLNVVVSERSNSIGSGNVSALRTGMSSNTRSGTGCLGHNGIVAVRKHRDGNVTLGAAGIATEGLGTGRGTGCISLSDGDPIVTECLLDNVVAYAATRAVMVLEAIGSTGNLNASVLVKHEIVAERIDLVRELLSAATHTVVESVALAETGCDNVGNKPVVAELITALCGSELGYGVVGEVVGLEYCVTLVIDNDILSLNESGLMNGLTVLVEDSREIPYYDIVGILATFKLIGDLNSDLTVEAGDVLTVNGHLEVVNVLTCKESLLLIGKIARHLVNDRLIYLVDGEIDVGAAELALSCIVDRERCIVELKLVLKLVTGYAGGGTAYYGLGLTTSADAGFVIVVSLGGLVILGIGVGASGTGVGLYTGGGTGCLGSDGEYVRVDSLGITVVCESIAAIAADTGLYCLEGTGHTVNGNGGLSPLNTLAVTGLKEAVGYSLVFAAGLTYHELIAVFGTSGLFDLGNFPAVALSLFCKRFVTSGAVGVGGAGSGNGSVTERIQGLCLLAAVVGAYVLNVARIGTGSIVALGLFPIVTDSVNGITGVVITAIRAGIGSISCRLTGGSGSGCYVVMLLSLKDNLLSHLTVGAGINAKTGNTASGLSYNGVVLKVIAKLRSLVSLSLCVTGGAFLKSISAGLTGRSYNAYVVPGVIDGIAAYEGLGACVTANGAGLVVHRTGLAVSRGLKKLAVFNVGVVVATGDDKVGVIYRVGTSLIGEILATVCTLVILVVTGGGTGSSLCVVVIYVSVGSIFTIGEARRTLSAAKRAGLLVYCKRGAGSLAYEILFDCVGNVAVRKRLSVGEGLCAKLAASAGVIVYRRRFTGSSAELVLLGSILLYVVMYVTERGEEHLCLILDYVLALCVTEVIVTAGAGPILGIAVLGLIRLKSIVMSKDVGHRLAYAKGLGAESATA